MTKSDLGLCCWDQDYIGGMITLEDQLLSFLKEPWLYETENFYFKVHETYFSTILMFLFCTFCTLAKKNFNGFLDCSKEAYNEQKSAITIKSKLYLATVVHS